MILIGQYDSPFVRRTAIAMRLYGLGYEHRPWSTFGDAEKIRPYNPLLRVPTLVLDDGGRFPRKSAPRFADFDHEFAAEGMGDRSFIFARGESSWHGVREISCPEGHFRRVFIVVVEDKRRALLHSVLDPLRGKKRARY